MTRCSLADGNEYRIGPLAIDDKDDLHLSASAQAHGQFDVDLIKPGEAALFSVSRAGSEQSAPVSLPVHAIDQLPERWDEATDLVRFRVDSGAQLEPNQTGLVKFAARLRNDLVVRESAVRDSPDGPYVLVTSDDRHTLSKRPVEIGSRLYDYAAVISGLAEGEYVVAKHTFALDAERRFGSATP